MRTFESVRGLPGRFRHRKAELRHVVFLLSLCSAVGLTLLQVIRSERASHVRVVRAGIVAERKAIERWFFTAFSFSMIVIVAGFLPSLLSASGRRAPLSMLAAAHGVASCAWIGIFLVQATLIARGRIATHMRVGVAAVCLAALMIPLGYATCISMVRRGFDLSGDLKVDRDPALAVIFPLGDLIIFAVLVTAAVAYRRRPDMHKRLMLFATIILLPAPLAHLIGHSPWLAALPAPIIGIPIFVLLAAAVAREFLTLRRVHPLTGRLRQLCSYPDRFAPSSLVRVRVGTAL
jgi:uncharacterized membrane protein YozB (DUF420 family)